MGKTNIGIPAKMTERIITVTRKQETICETENQEKFISLPALMRQKETAAPHGIVLKQCAKTTLLTPKIDAETEIPEENIHSLPKVMNGMYRYFKGAYCTDKNVILILAPEKLLESNI